MSKRLRIVSVCRSLPNPADPSSGIFVLNRLQAMARAADVTVVQPIPYLPGVRSLPSWAQEPVRRVGNVEIHHAPMLYVPGALKSLDGYWLARAVWPLARALHARAPLDAIDAHFGYPEGVGCQRVAERLGVPLFITVRGFENEYVARRFVGPQMLDAMRKAAGCICVSHSLRELLLRHGVAPDKAGVIHNAIDSNVFRFGAREAARQGLGIAPGQSLVVSVGHLVSRKRHHVLIEALAELRARQRDAVLVVIGARSFERTYPDELTALAERLGVAGAVRFLGNIAPADVAVWLRAADAFALGTAREGCCNAVLEALAVGVPVVTTPAGDNAYFVKDGQNGFIVPVDDAPALARGIEAALETHWQRPQIAAALSAAAGSWDGVGRRVLDFMTERLRPQSAA